MASLNVMVFADVAVEWTDDACAGGQHGERRKAVGTLLGRGLQTGADGGAETWA